MHGHHACTISVTAYSEWSTVYNDAQHQTVMSNKKLDCGTNYTDPTWQRETEDGLQCPGVDVDTFATTHLNRGGAMTFDLQHLTRSSVGGYWLFPVSFIDTAQVLREIWCSQGLTSTTCCDLDLWPTESNQFISRGLMNISCQFYQNCSSRSRDILLLSSLLFFFSSSLIFFFFFFSSPFTSAPAH